MRTRDRRWCWRANWRGWVSRSWRRWERRNVCAKLGLKVENVFKVNEGRPNIVDHIKRGEIALVINTPLGRASHFDEQAIRRAALQYNVPCVTTMTGAQAIVEAISARGTDGADQGALVAGIARGQRRSAVSVRLMAAVP